VVSAVQVRYVGVGFLAYAGFWLVGLAGLAGLFAEMCICTQ